MKKYIILLLMSAMLTGCSEAAMVEEAENHTENVEITQTSETETSAATDETEKSVTEETSPINELASFTVNPDGILDTSSMFSERDLKQNADLSEAKNIAVSDNSVIDITEEGVYLISGTADNCTIKVTAPETAKVQLVLDNLNVSNSDNAVIYVTEADKAFVTVQSDCELSVNGSFMPDGETNVDAVIFSKSDLVLNGKGSLAVSSAEGNGITSKDDLKITGGTYNVTAAKHGFEANDSIVIADGDFTVNCQKDAFHCKNDSDDTKGYIYTANGNFDLTAESDGFQATTILQIDGGTFNITAPEGLESTYIQINGGDISIDSSDDGINAAAKSSAYEVAIEINGGNIKIVMGAGDTDAVDANGNIYVNGGIIDVTSQMSSFDYDGTAEYTGGTIIVNGTQVDEIPQSMQGGHGGMGGGRGKMWF